MYPAKFEYAVARSVDDAIRILGDHGGEAKLLAGGHSLVPMMKLRLVQPQLLVDINRVPGLHGVREEDGYLAIGALTRHAELASSPPVRERAFVLAEAAAEIGDLQVRNRGTIGGSVAHADPGADLPVALLALDATFIAAGPGGQREIAVADFFLDLFTTSLGDNEILIEVRVPILPGGTGSAYRKLSHPASGYAVVSCAAVIVLGIDGLCTDVRIAMGGMGITPLRVTQAEMALAGKGPSDETIAAAVEQLAQVAEPLGELYAPADYKGHMGQLFARQALEAAAQRAGQRP